VHCSLQLRKKLGWSVQIWGGGPDPPPLTLSGCALARCRIAGREFSLKNLNVTLDYFCDRPIERGSTACGKTPTSRTLGSALGDVRENPDIIPLKRANSCGGSRPPYNIWFSGPIRVYTSPKASRSVQPFLQGSRSLQTDRQTDGPR